MDDPSQADPYSRSRLYNVRTLTPNASAALRRSPSKCVERGQDQPALGFGEGGEGGRVAPQPVLVAGQLGRQLRGIDLLSARMKARWITFLSSRTLPGQA